MVDRNRENDSKYLESKISNDFQEDENIEYIDNSSLIPKDILNKVILGNSQNMSQIPDNSVHFIVTSPPYNVCKEDADNLSLKEYLELLESVFKECWRVLMTGGKIAINVANLGRRPYIPLHYYIIDIMLRIGFTMRAEIIWNKGSSVGVSTAWGSYASPSSPYIRDIHEYILIFSKHTNKLKSINTKSSISEKDFLEWSKSIWNFPTESANDIGHPTPFPEELPKRLIEFYTYIGDIVLDPFLGSGTTGLVALKLNRFFIGFDISAKYVELANKRIKNYTSQLKLDSFLKPAPKRIYSLDYFLKK